MTLKPDKLAADKLNTCMKLENTKNLKFRNLEKYSKSISSFKANKDLNKDSI